MEKKPFFAFHVGFDKNIIQLAQGSLMHCLYRLRLPSYQPIETLTTFAVELRSKWLLLCFQIGRERKEITDKIFSLESMSFTTRST